MRKIIIVICVLLLVACKSEAELALERGIQFYEWNLVDKAIIEFNQAVRYLSANPKPITLERAEKLAMAHHNLSIAYVKKGWYDVAESEAKTTFRLVPSEENRQFWISIRHTRRQSQK